MSSTMEVGKETEVVDKDFEIISTLRLDPHRPDLGPHDSDFPFTQFTNMLDYHRDRMLVAAIEFAWPLAQQLLIGESGMLCIKSSIAKHLQETYTPFPTEALKVSLPFDFWDPLAHTR